MSISEIPQTQEGVLNLGVSESRSHGEGADGVIQASYLQAMPSAGLTPVAAIVSPIHAEVVMRNQSPTQQPTYKIATPQITSPENGGKAKRESLKVQKRVYRIEKKRAAKEILSTLRDPSVVLMADHLKVRGMLKSWTRFWSVLKPGVLILYKSQKQKSGHWVGTIILNSAKLIERPSKKDGFCFKIYHPLDQSIWAQKGPKGETYGALTQPLMYSSAIFRAPSETAGKSWMDALELALRCSSLLMGTGAIPTLDFDPMSSEENSHNDPNSSYLAHINDPNDDLNDSDREDHFKDLKESGNRTEGATECSEDTETTSGSDSEDEERNSDEFSHAEGVTTPSPIETTYSENEVDVETRSSGPLSEEFADENKNIIWCLMKQVRPGMDLSKVTLPTFILEPRSLLEKFADYYYHCDILSKAAKCDDALTRMKEVVRWYVSGFYKTPKGVKKPYNPILGEKFRCYWKNEDTNSRTFYIAEQISHHPPVSAFYVTNRQDGFSINCAVLAKSKFYGNSVSAVMDGVGKLTFLKLGEEYSITIPYGCAKGILIGSLTMELGGKVTIGCDKTGYKAELEFKLKSFMGGSDSANKISGKIKLGHETLYSLDGRWDQEIFLKDKTTGLEQSFWKVDSDTPSNRLKRFTVPINCQGEFESERLWQHVSEALKSSDQERATHEKFLLEDAQRNSAKERKITNTAYQPALFEVDKLTRDWIYKYSDLRPWDPVNDIKQYEQEFKVLTQTRHRTPLVRQMSIVNVNSGGDPSGRTKTRHIRQQIHRGRGKDASDSSTPSHISDNEQASASSEKHHSQMNSPSSMTASSDTRRATSSPRRHSSEDISMAILRQSQQEANDRLRNLQSIVIQTASNQQEGTFLQTRDWLVLALILCLQTLLQYLFSRN